MLRVMRQLHSGCDQHQISLRQGLLQRRLRLLPSFSPVGQLLFLVELFDRADFLLRPGLVAPLKCPFQCPKPCFALTPFFQS